VGAIVTFTLSFRKAAWCTTFKFASDLIQIRASLLQKADQVIGAGDRLDRFSEKLILGAKTSLIDQKSKSGPEKLVDFPSVSVAVDPGTIQSFKGS
jgi:hypothetical protein